MEPHHNGLGVAFGFKKVPIRRPRKACTICRGLKTRCLPDGDNTDPQSRCSRCARLNLVCEYSRARRARRNSDENNSPPSARRTNGSSNQHDRFHPHNGIPLSRVKWEAAAAYNTNTINNGNNTNGNAVSEGGMFIPDMLDNKAGDWGQPRHAPMPISKHSPDLYSLSSGSDTRPSPLAQYGLLPGKNSATFEDYLSPPLQIIDGPQAAFHGRNADEDAPPVSAEALSETYSNPIEMGYMTETYARNLFALFITRVAPSSSLFDPYYHTLERVRQSPVLFTAVLSAAALFMRPELADSLRKLADEHINRMISSGYYDLSLIQAILVLVNWKHPNDRTAYQKMGMAVRLVQELRLARIATSPNASESPKNSNEQRRKVDIERTVQWCFGVWLVGTSLTTGHDIALSYALQLPPAQFSPMPTADQVNRWAESHRHLNVHGDFFLAFNAGLWEAHSSCGGHPRFLIEGTPVKYTMESFNQVNQRLEEHLNLFRNHPALRENPYVGLCQLMTDVALLKVRTVGWLQKFAPTSTSTWIIEKCNGFLEVFKRTTDIIFCSDLIISQVCVPGIMLNLARKNFTQDERGRCSAIMLQIAEVAQRYGALPGGQRTMPLIGRFYVRLAEKFDRRDDELSPNTSLQAFPDGSWPELSVFVNPMVPLPSTSAAGATSQWTWSNVLTIPSWEAGMMPQ